MSHRRTPTQEGLTDSDISDEEDFEQPRSTISETKWNLAAFWYVFVSIYYFCH